MSKKVIIVRGIPGSGKSTYVKENFPKAQVCSADSFHVDKETGEYRYDFRKAGEAHATCLYNFIMALKLGRSEIVVDNTNIQYWEYRNYIEIAELAGYDVEVHETRLTDIRDVREAAERCTHGVPWGIIGEMAMNFNDDMGDGVITFKSKTGRRVSDKSNITEVEPSSPS